MGRGSTGAGSVVVSANLQLLWDSAVVSARAMPPAPLQPFTGGKEILTLFAPHSRER